MNTMSSNQKNDLLLTGIRQGKYPSTLYKYRSIAQADRILSELEFWFAAPQSFNDPFDCSLDEVMAYSSTDMNNFLTSDAACNLSQAGRQTLINCNSTHSNTLRDLINKIKNSALNRRGVFALSETYDDILLWSHYADNHEGIVIGLDVKEDLGFFIYPMRMKYQNSYQPSNYIADPTQSINQSLTIKSSQWAYEKEVRVYKTPSGAHPINGKAIKEIYFGLKTNDQDISRIKIICLKKGLTHVIFYKAKKTYGIFSLTFDKI